MESNIVSAKQILASNETPGLQKEVLEKRSSEKAAAKSIFADPSTANTVINININNVDLEMKLRSLRNKRLQK